MMVERRDQRVAQRVVKQDAQLARALGPRGQDVVLVQHVEHAGPHQPRDRSSTVQPSTKAGSEQVAERIRKSARSPASSESMVNKPVTKGGAPRAHRAGPGPAASRVSRRR